MMSGISELNGLIRLLLLATLLPACEPVGAPITGRAVVVDGDSLNIDGISIRLFGVDAFEGRQTCALNDSPWRCGDEAASKLEQLVGNATIVCEKRDIDTYGRTVAVCTSGSIDLSSELARSGLALAYRQYSTDYVDEEAEAAAAHRGAWAGTFDAPWDWRRRSSNDSAESYLDEDSAESPSSTVSGDCVIKGNVNNERIYHLPGSPSYDATIIDESNGERWFCSEAEAKAAGWRAPRAR